MIVSTTLAGPGASDIIADALRSAEGLVDRYLVIESGGGPEALRVARETVGADRLVVGHMPWEGHYGDARNAALALARRIGADWALTLDTDERLDFNRPPELDDPSVDVVQALDRDYGYPKPRFIRCREGIEWRGRAHELLSGTRTPWPVAEGAFWELPKTREQRVRVFERFVQWVKEEPQTLNNPPWRRHYADCLLGLGEYDRAAEQFRFVAELEGSDNDERAWCHYRLGELDILGGNHERCMRRAAQALALYPWRIQEFGWLLAHVHAARDNNREAVTWAEYALAAPMVACAGQRSPSWKQGCLELLACLRTEPGMVMPVVGEENPKVRSALRAGVYEDAELELFTAAAAPGDRLLELGAGCGFIATHAAKLLGDDAVLTIEADAAMEHTIRATFDANSVKPELRIAAVNGTGEARAVERRGEFWSTRTVAGNDVCGVALGSLIASHRPTVIVCDIEGGEADLVTTSLPGVNSIIIEVHSEELERQVNEWLTREGFALARRLRMVHWWRRQAPEGAQL